MNRCMRSRRFLELVQLVLALASVTAVMDASRAAAEQSLRAGAAYARSSADHERTADRRLSDLARFERKRREAAQRASCRARAIEAAVPSVRADDAARHSLVAVPRILHGATGRV